MNRTVATGTIHEVVHRNAGDKPVVNFRLDAEGMEFRCVAFGSLGDEVAEGRRVIIEGRQQKRTWQTRDNPPQPRTSIELIASSLEVLAVPAAEEAVDTDEEPL